MNKNNLIIFGVLAQKKFNLKEGFEIKEYPSDAGNEITINQIEPAKDQGVRGIMSPFFASSMETDRVRLVKFASYEDFQFIWAGYSEKLNILVIRESRE